MPSYTNRVLGNDPLNIGIPEPTPPKRPEKPPEVKIFDQQRKGVSTEKYLEQAKALIVMLGLCQNTLITANQVTAYVQNHQ